MTTPRSIRLLKLLKDGPESGMLLSELMGELCEFGHGSESATVMMLLDMRRKSRVGYLEPRKGATQRGGRYTLTEDGSRYLARKLKTHPEWAEDVGEGEIETGVMHGERRSVVVRTVEDCGVCLLVVVPNWVFGLARQPRGVLQSPWRR
jgi:DNA-binding PadR family transcriptional regulator